VRLFSEIISPSWEKEEEIFNFTFDRLMAVDSN
jgi:hypothetical protein